METISNLPTPGGLPDTSKGGSALGQLAGDIDMFLTLLTTQMRNQDPLDPMDSSEYTQQLVQFSQVEQSIQQTSTLKDILASMTTQDIAQASSFIGREVEFSSNVSGLSDKPAQWSWSADRKIDTIKAEIRDSAGTVVAEPTVAGGRAGTVEWDGILADGSKAPEGAYKLSLTGQDASGGAVGVSVTSIGIVNDVSAVSGEILLGVNGASLPTSALLRVASAD